MEREELREFLDQKADQYNRKSFIEEDPILLPHQFSKKEDIEILGFLVATIAWGQRKTIIKNGFNLIELTGNSPYDFTMNASEEDLKSLLKFKHRTFQGKDLLFFIQALRSIYQDKGGLEGIFTSRDSIKEGIVHLRKSFLETPHEQRSEKHLSNPLKGSAAKRINMYLRWMVRQDNKGVDFGLWKNISPSLLRCPLDVHVGNVARKLNLIQRNANDWKALEELHEQLILLDPKDPVKYDFALFGLGVYEKF